MNEIAFFPSLLKIVFALAIVLGLMVAAMYVAKKYMNRTASGNGDGSLIQIIASRYIGPKSSILLLDVAGKGIVVGLSNGQLTLLTQIDDETVLERMKTAREREIANPVLADFLKRYSAKIKTLSGERKGGHRR